jgi:hypothetical protein
VAFGKAGENCKAKSPQAKILFDSEGILIILVIVREFFRGKNQFSILSSFIQFIGGEMVSTGNQSALNAYRRLLYHSVNK